MSNALKTFALKSEKALESTLFDHRKIWLILFSLLTLFLGYYALQLKPDASFSRMVPAHHPYIEAGQQHTKTIKGSENALKIAVNSNSGDIYNEEYMEILRRINDDIFYLPGVDRAGMQSLWTPNVRWSEVTEEGFEGDSVIPKSYDGSIEAIEILKGNVLKSGQVGRLVANDFKSSIIVVPLLETNPITGDVLNYQDFSHLLESKIRDKYQNDQISIHIIGSAKILGDFLDGIVSIGIFGLLALAIIFCLLYWYSRCIRSTIVPLICSGIAVIWQLGLLGVTGNGLDAYSVLVPFLIFSIAISHSVQIINSIAHESAHGASRINAARTAFRGLYIAGMTALVSDAVGFLTLLIIDIEVIRSLAIAASLGVAVIIITNLALLPILMSYIGVGSATSRYAIEEEKGKKLQELKIWQLAATCTRRKYATIPLAIAATAFALGLVYSQNLKIGDLDKGAPELRTDSRYNQDNNFIVENYSASSDVLTIMVESPPEACSSHQVLNAVDDLQWSLNNTQGVQSTLSLANISKQVNVGMNEGNWKWHEVSRNRSVLNNSVSRNIPEGMMNTDCSMMTIAVFLNDHKAETLNKVIDTVTLFTVSQTTKDVFFKLAAGNGGIAAATNQEIETAQQRMLILVYAVVGFLILLTFRSLAAVTCVLLPLALTSVLCQALMTYLNIGIKVATLPVIALGVGIGVDYGIYIYTRFREEMLRHDDIHTAYMETLKTTGRAVGFTGITLAAGVMTWIMSPIKFQADMGMLLAFMFLLNMIGAIFLIPALAGFMNKPLKLAEAQPAIAKT